MRSIYYYNTEIGKIGIAEKGGLITDILFIDPTALQNDYNFGETPVIKKAAKQLREYFLGKRKVFDLPLSINGTPFQTIVWEALISIPYGETRSYKDIAIQIGKNKACRAIGMANNRNTIPIVIPCHRVIGSKGELVGYGGGLEVKQMLLEIEGNNIVNAKVH